MTHTLADVRKRVARRKECQHVKHGTRAWIKDERGVACMVVRPSMYSGGGYSYISAENASWISLASTRSTFPIPNTSTVPKISK